MKEAYIVAGYRSAVGKAKKAALKIIVLMIWRQM